MEFLNILMAIVSIILGVISMGYYCSKYINKDISV